MSSLHNSITNVAQQGQDAVSGAVRAWAEQVQRFTGPVGGLPDASALTTLVDSWFDLAEQVLAAQRAAAKAVLQALSAGVGGAADAGLRVVDGQARRP